MTEEINPEQPTLDKEQPLQENACSEETAVLTEESKSEVSPTENSIKESTAETKEDAKETSNEQPKMIIQTERSFAHYVGFAFLCVLCICFFFMPGIAISYAVSRIVTLTGAAAWIFSLIISVITWLIFKLKIKGFKKSFYGYIGLCVFVLGILITIQIMADVNIFAEILALLTGANA